MRTADERILQTCLENLAEGSASLDELLARYPEQTEWLRPALESAAWLQDQRPVFEARPGFVAASRRRLVERIQAQPARLRPWQTLFAWRAPWLAETRRRLGYALLLLVLVFQIGLNGVTIAHAAPTWLPGDAPYPAKTAYEGASLVLTLNQMDQAGLHALYARRRLLEIQALIFEERYEPIPAAVDNLQYHTRQATALIERLASSDAHNASLLAADLRQTLTAQAKLIDLLARFAPDDTRLQCQRVRQIADQALAQIDAIGASDTPQP
jgi:hypothetical protein